MVPRTTISAILIFPGTLTLKTTNFWRIDFCYFSHIWWTQKVLWTAAKFWSSDFRVPRYGESNMVPRTTCVVYRAIQQVWPSVVGAFSAVERWFLVTLWTCWGTIDRFKISGICQFITDICGVKHGPSKDNFGYFDFSDNLTSKTTNFRRIDFCYFSHVWSTQKLLPITRKWGDSDE